MEDIKQNEVVYADQRAVGARDAASQAAESVLRAQRALQAFQPQEAKGDEEKQREIEERPNPFSVSVCNW